MTVGYAPGTVETDPPGITTRTPAPSSTGVGGGTDLTVTFDEPMDAATITGSTFTLRANGAGSDVPAAVSFNAGTATATLDPSTNLPGSTTFTVTVHASVADLAGNQLGADDTWTFTTGTVTASLVDTTEGDFGAGTTGANTYVAVTTDGEVILVPTIGAEFSGTTLPAGWSSTLWSNGQPGGSSVAGGSLTVDGARANTSAAPAFGPGRSLEFVATFGAATFQNAGLGQDLATGNEQWVMFGTAGSGTNLFTRVNTGGGTSVDVDLGTALVGSPHRYRIDWGAEQVVFSVDGTIVDTRAVSIVVAMRPVASDFGAGGPTLSLDWLRMSPYSSPGTFTSRVLDAGSTVTLGNLSAVSDTPAGTTISFRVRHGNTPTPDGTWSAFAALPGSGAVGGSARYVQYEATLSSSSSGASPALRSVAIGFTSAPDTSAPSIAVRAPSAGATNVAVASNVTVTFDEPMDPATITGSTFRLRAQGAGSDVAAAVTYDPVTTTATLDPAADLANGTTYDVTVAATVADASGNQLGSTAPWAFTTAVALSGLTDTTAADFSAGTPDASTYVSQTTDGEVILNPTVGSEFNGSSLPAGWSSTNWDSGGTSTVASGRLTVDGARANPSAAPSYGPGRSIEFVATFGAATFQTVGLADTLATQAEQWMQFGTANSSTTLFARTNIGNNPVDVSLGTAYIGSQHRYRIDWTASQVVYSIDGSVVHTAAAAVAGPLRPAVSDLTVGGPTISVDWLRMTPYAASTTFTSRVLDAHSPAAWAALSWTAATPAGTTVALSYRTGNTLVPDGSWTSFTAVAASGGGLTGTSRYIQYRAVLSTTDPSQTPTLSSVCRHLPGRGVRHDAAVRHLPNTGGGRHRCRRQRERHRDLRRADRSGHAHHVERPVASAGRRRGCCGCGVLQRRDGDRDARPVRGPGGEHPLHRHARELDRGHIWKHAGLGRDLDLPYGLAASFLHRHHDRRLRCRDDRREHIRVRNGEWRGHPQPDCGRGVLRDQPAHGLVLNRYGPPMGPRRLRVEPHPSTARSSRRTRATTTDARSSSWRRSAPRRTSTSGLALTSTTLGAGRCSVPATQPIP